MAALDVGGFHGPWSALWSGSLRSSTIGLAPASCALLGRGQRSGTKRSTPTGRARTQGDQATARLGDLLAVRPPAVDCLREELGADLARPTWCDQHQVGVGPIQRRVVDLLAGARGVQHRPLSALSTSWRRYRPHRKRRAGHRRQVRRLPMWAFGPEPPGVTPAPSTLVGRAPILRTRPRPRCASPIPPNAYSPRCSTSMEFAGNTNRRVRPALDDGARPTRVPARLLAGRPAVFRRAHHGRPAPGHPQERQGPPHA